MIYSAEYSLSLILLSFLFTPFIDIDIHKPHTNTLEEEEK